MRPSRAGPRVKERTQTILITGGCGFLGTWIARHLLQANDHVQLKLFDLRSWEALATLDKPHRAALASGRVTFHQVPRRACLPLGFPARVVAYGPDQSGVFIARRVGEHLE